MIDQNGTKVGVVSINEARQLAQQAGLDLVEVAPQAQPPVAKIVDFGKLLYQQEKQERKNRAKTKKGEVKGVRLTRNIGEHDLSTRVKTGQKFLAEGDKVKVELRMRGRERAHPELAKQVMERYISMLGEDLVLEQPIKLLGHCLTALIAKKS